MEPNECVPAEHVDSHLSQTSRWKRKIQACAKCRKGKTKCDGILGEWPCSKCRNKPQDCKPPNSDVHHKDSSTRHKEKRLRPYMESKRSQDNAARSCQPLYSIVSIQDNKVALSDDNSSAAETEYNYKADNIPSTAPGYSIDPTAEAYFDRTFLMDESFSRDTRLVVQDSAGRLRVNVILGAEISRMLSPGQTPFLTAVGAVQFAQFSGMVIGRDSCAILGYLFHPYSTPDRFQNINCLEPWLFTMALGTEEEQQTFYRKVWRLHRNVNHLMTITKLGLSTTLLLVTPQFKTLQVTILIRGRRGEDCRLILEQDDKEGIDYTFATEYDVAEWSTQGGVPGDNSGSIYATNLE